MKYFPKTGNKIRKRFLRRKNSCLKNQKLQQSTFLGIQSRDFSFISASQLEAGRRFLTRKLKKKSNVFHRIMLTQPVTRKSALSRMGRGTGKFKTYIGTVRPGRFLFESPYLDIKDLNFKNMNKINRKLPFKTRLIIFQNSFKNLYKHFSYVKFVSKKV